MKAWRIMIAICVCVGGWRAFAQAPASQPVTPAPVIVDRRPLQLSPAVAQLSVDLLKKVHIEAITYLSDGLRIKGYLVVPEGAGPFPCVIVNRGGNQNVGIWTDDSALKSLSRFAAWGYVAVASQYRGAGGSEGHDEFGGADVNDVMNLIPLLKTVPGADVNRIGMFGASRGGMMAYLALTRTDRIRAAIVLSGMSDLAESLRSRPELAKPWKDMVPDYANNRDTALRQRSAINWIDKLPANVPLLIMHGTADWRVSPSQAFEMARGLYDAKRPVRFVMYEGGSHGVPEFAEDRDMLMHQWLDAYVRDGRKWPDLKPHGE
jgi:dipeptidyl aminopeptidase/acylaminoacyl peptidase